MTDEYNFTDYEGVSYHDYDSYVLIGLCGLCGCLDSEIEEDIFSILDRFGRVALSEKPTIWYTDLLPRKPDYYIELILHVLTHANLIEHGGSVRGSWITPKGVGVIRDHRFYQS